MKRKLIILVGSMIILAIAVLSISFYISSTAGKASKNADSSINVVTSFYPSYIITVNITDGITDIEVDSLTDFTGGCLHDYQLTTDDMKLLSNADVFIINGGGMEEYLEEVIGSYPDLKVIDLSKGITILKSEIHEGEDNPHVWLDPELYMLQIENARNGLENFIRDYENKGLSNGDFDREHKEKIIEKLHSNAEEYLEKVSVLAADMNNILDTVKDMVDNKKLSNKVVVFHDSFAYLSSKAGLEVAFTVEIDEDTPLSAGEVAEVISAIKEDNIRYLFTEEQYDDNIVDRIKEETDAKVYIIDSAVTGDTDKDSYLKAMRKNIDTLKKAFDEP